LKGHAAATEELPWRRRRRGSACNQRRWQWPERPFASFVKGAWPAARRRKIARCHAAARGEGCLGGGGVARLSEQRRWQWPREPFSSDVEEAWPAARRRTKIDARQRKREGVWFLGVAGVSAAYASVLRLGAVANDDDDDDDDDGDDDGDDDDDEALGVGPSKTPPGL
jgi:hypothetical protein